ncbi:glucosamine-6-phosphate deaminase [Escherichia coli]|nr:glucosamine-6-phosphate deaminase [Escherichia coli]
MFSQHVDSAHFKWALDDAPRDKCVHFREINGIAAAFQYLQKNYNPTARSSL